MDRLEEVDFIVEEVFLVVEALAVDVDLWVEEDLDVDLLVDLLEDFEDDGDDLTVEKDGDLEVDPEDLDGDNDE